MHFDLFSLFPEAFDGPLDVSMIKRAREKGVVSIHSHNIRDFSDEKHQRVDDRPYGGGPGMVMMAKPVVDAIKSVKKEGSVAIYLSPQGEKLTATRCKELASKEHLILLCGHYEGVDERALEEVIDLEINPLADVVVTSGILPALVLIDAVARFVPGVLGHDEAATEDTFSCVGGFDAPHYTRPEEYNGKRVPDILRSGHAAHIAAWRKEEGEKKLKKVRPDLAARR